MCNLTPQTRLPAINAREPKPSDKCKQVAAKAQTILGHTPNIAGKDSKSLFPVVKPPQAAAYDAATLKGLGVDLSSLVRAGFDCSSLVKAGLDAAVLKNAGFSIRDITFAGCMTECCVVR